MATFNEFIKDRGLTMDAIYVGTSENDTRFDWIVTIKMGNKKWRVDYHMGMAHCGIKRLNLGYHASEIGRLKRSAKTIEQLKRFGEVVPTKPVLSEVLYSLQFDVMVKDNYSDKWDFIAEMGLDGREGERVYNLCLMENQKAHDFLGELYNEFTELEED